MSSSRRFQVGGALQRDSVYVKRPKDREYLVRAFESRAWINIHGCRTMGKTSLWIKHLPALRQAGIVPIAIDVAAQIGSHLKTERDWIRAMGEAIASDLQHPRRRLIGNRIKQLPAKVAAGVALERLFEVLLDQSREPVFLILEEYDYVFQFDYCDEILFAFRHIQSLQARSTSLDQLSVCFVGLQPLMRYGTPGAANKSPIATSIEMLDFDNNEETVNTLKEGFDAGGGNESIIHRVLKLSGGQPLVTMELLQNALLRRCQTPSEVDRMTAELVADSGLGRDLQLFESMESAVLAAGGRALAALSTYMTLLEGNREADAGLGVDLLLLYGLVRRKNDRLEVKGELFRRRFNVAWVKRMLSTIASAIE